MRFPLGEIVREQKNPCKKVFLLQTHTILSDTVSDVIKREQALTVFSLPHIFLTFM